MKPILSTALPVAMSAPAIAQMPGAASAVLSSPPSAAGSLLQMALALIFVLLVIFAVAWLLRRFTLLQGGTGQHLRVVSGLMVGQRERVVIVEVGNEWLVLGVTSNQVNLLRSMPRPEGAEPLQPVAPPFAQWLEKALGKSLPGARK